MFTNIYASLLYLDVLPAQDTYSFFTLFLLRYHKISNGRLQQTQVIKLEQQYFYTLVIITYFNTVVTIGMLHKFNQDAFSVNIGIFGADINYNYTTGTGIDIDFGIPNNVTL